MALHDRPDHELRAMLASGTLGKKRAQVAQAVLNRRRLERLQEWLSRHSWIAALVAVVGVSALLFPQLTQSEDPNG